MSRSLSLRQKLLLTAGGLQAVVLALSLGAAYRIFSQSLIEQLQGQALMTRQVLAPAVIPSLVERQYAELQEALQAVTGEGDAALVYVQVLDLDGKPVAQAGTVPADLAQRPGGHAGLEDAGVMRYAAAVGAVAPGTPSYGQLRFGLSLKAHDDGLRQLSWVLLAIGVAGLSLGLALQSLIAEALTRGLKQLVSGVQALQARQRVTVLPVQGDDEIAQLSLAFNAMSASLVQHLSELQASELRQRTLFESINDGVLLFDGQGQVLSFNQAALDILGLDRTQVMDDAPPPPGWRLVDAQGAEVPEAESPSRVALRTGQPVLRRVLGVHRPDGSLAWIQCSAQPLFAQGQVRPNGAASSFTDITARVQAEHQLRHSNELLDQRVSERTAALEAARAQAEAANRAKSEFLSRMSHELRTPLNAILGFAQVLLNDPGAREAREQDMLTHMERAGWHLLELINDVLDLSRIETGTMAVSSEPVWLHPLCDESIRMIEPLAQAQGVQVKLHLEAASGLAVQADKTRLRQVLVNLLSNAVKYNRPGGRVDLQVREVGSGLVEVAVSDTGHGLRPDQLERLFEPFNRLGAETGQVGGTGIGLVITRHLVELMGGRIEVRSTPGLGSEFLVQLGRARPPVAADGTGPAAGQAPAEASHAAPEPALQSVPRLMLYVEDNDANVALMREIVALRPDLRLAVAADPWDGLAQAVRLRPELIALDIALPHMDGFELLARLRAEPGLQQVPVVAISANALPSDRARGLQAGFDGYCTKPLRIADFLQLVDDLLPRNTTR